MQNQQSEHNSALENQLMVALALSAHRRPIIGSQQAAKEKAWQEFLQAEPISNQESLLESIDSNPDYFAHWIKQGQEKAQQAQAKQQTSGVLAWFTSLIDSWQQQVQSQWLLPAAFSVVIAVFGVLMFNNVLHEQHPMTQSYAEIIKLNQKSQQPAKLEPLVNQYSGAYAFSSTSPETSILSDFLLGVEQGQQQINNAQNESLIADSAWQEFGQWYQLNRFVSHSDFILDKSFWMQQQALLIQIEPQLAAAPSLSKIHKALNALQLQPEKARHKLKLKQSLHDYWIAIQVSQHGQ